jgi:hypothetical protein
MQRVPSSQLLESLSIKHLRTSSHLMADVGPASAFFGIHVAARSAATAPIGSTAPGIIWRP